MKPKKSSASVTTLRIVKNQPSEDLIEALSWLMTEVVAGRVSGIAYGALRSDKQFYIETVGEAHRDPLRTLGIVQCLSRELTDKILPRE